MGLNSPPLFTLGFGAETQRMNECSEVELICYWKVASYFCSSVSQIRSRRGDEFSKILQMIGSGRGNACCNFQGWHLSLLQRLLSASRTRHSVGFWHWILS
ncbi:hypothetical protein V6N13_039644 [Hibiscus sabdariffa]